MNINHILAHCNLNYIDIFEMDKSKFKTILTNNIDEPDWQSFTIKELLDMREVPSSTELDVLEVKQLLLGVCTDYLVS